MQKAIFPLRKCTETQAMDVGSHKDIKAIDFARLKDYPNETKVYAPFDGTIVFIDKRENGHGIAFQSLNKVEYADGTIDYMTVWTGHDNDVSNLKVGQIINQGTHYSDMGNAGNATGIHCHLEVIKGKFIKPTKVTKMGSWKIDNTIEPYKALFLTEDTIIKDSKYQWKRLPKDIDIIGNPVEKNNKVDQIEVLIDILRVRDNPNGNILGYIKKGIYNILNSKKLDDYLWCEVESGKWIAYSDEWAIFYKKEIEEELDDDIEDIIENLPEEKKVNILIKLLNELIKILQNIFKRG